MAAAKGTRTDVEYAFGVLGDGHKKKRGERGRRPSPAVTVSNKGPTATNAWWLGAV